MLKNIDDPSDLGDALFGFAIRYNDITDPLKRLYNGNISQTLWNSQSPVTGTNPISSQYTYTYDALNRITSATDNTTNYDLELVEYDRNGNIQKLKRKGHTQVDGNGLVTAFGIMDDLVYAYDSGNRLLGVSDGENAVHGFVDGNTIGNDYGYDANGNMTSDANKGITDIGYNHLNLPAEITVDGNGNVGNIVYIYDATGTKLRKIVTSTGESSLMTTDYAGNYIYENNSLQFFGHPEGYVTPDGNGGYDYVYQYRDHLGNVRLSYSDLNNDGDIDVTTDPMTTEILEENNYYPFGLEHKGYNNVVNGTEYNHKRFLGQEMNKELGLNWLTFRYRNYMPDIGRFFGSDPIAEDFYSISNYQFAHNNPIWKIELEGLEGKALSGVDVVNREPVTYTTEIDGGSVSFQTRRVYVRDYTVTSTGNGGYSAFDNGGSYQTRVKSNDAGSNNWYGDTEYNYNVYEQGANEPITISTQSEQSTTVPGMIEEKYSPSDENKARALENTGGTLENAGDGGVVAFTLSKTPIGLALSQTASLTGAVLNVAADAERNQYGKAGKKVGTEIITEVGARVVEKKTKSNWIKAAYEALSSWFDNTVND